MGRVYFAELGIDMARFEKKKKKKKRGSPYSHFR